MSDTSVVRTSSVGVLMFWGFIIIKFIGHLFAAWSWWWLFLPVVPWFGVAIERFGL